VAEICWEIDTRASQSGAFGSFFRWSAVTSACYPDGEIDQGSIETKPDQEEGGLVGDLFNIEDAKVQINRLPNSDVEVVLNWNVEVSVCPTVTCADPGSLEIVHVFDSSPAEPTGTAVDKPNGPPGGGVSFESTTRSFTK
jgi:hypothetical protein